MCREMAQLVPPVPPPLGRSRPVVQGQVSVLGEGPVGLVLVKVTGDVWPVQLGISTDSIHQYKPRTEAGEKLASTCWDYQRPIIGWLIEQRVLILDSRRIHSAVDRMKSNCGFKMIIGQNGLWEKSLVLSARIHHPSCYC